MEVSTLFFVCLVGSCAGLLMGLVKPALFALKDGTVPARWKVAGVWAFLIVASLIGTGVHSDREKAALARMQEQPSADTPAADPGTEPAAESAPAESPKADEPAR